MRIHAIICTYLGDLELDIGKTSRWIQYFTDSLFFYDANSTGEARHYVVDYSKSWPEAQVAYHPNTSPGFQQDPPTVRQMAFQAGDKAWGYDPGDWVIFCDGTESISTDVPHDGLELVDPDIPRFRYLYDEAKTADSLVQNFLSMPIRIFMSQGTVVEHPYYLRPDLANDDPNNPQAVWWSCDPHYLSDTASPSPFQLMRFGRVDKLRTLVRADWQKMDVYGSYTPQTQHVSLITYSYARYSEIDYHDPTKWVQANDEGFASRLYMQQVPGRHISALPVVYATPDPPGYIITVPPGPARILTEDVFDPQNDKAFLDFTFTGHVTKESGNETYSWNFGDSTTDTGQTVDHTFPDVPADSHTYTVTLTVNDPDVGSPRTATVQIRPGAMDAITEQPPDPAPSLPPTRMLSPAYCYYVNSAIGQYVMAFSALWRQRPRDGVWYQEMVIGTIPLSPVTGQPDLGKDADGNPIDPVYWDVQQPQPSPVITVPNETGPGI